MKWIKFAIALALWITAYLENNDTELSKSDL